MEALRQPENRLKGFLRPAGGASRPTSRANPHRVKRNGRRHGNRTTGHSVYANDNPAGNTDPNGKATVYVQKNGDITIVQKFKNNDKQFSPSQISSAALQLIGRTSTGKFISVTLQPAQHGDKDIVSINSDSSLNDTSPDSAKHSHTDKISGKKITLAPNATSSTIAHEFGHVFGAGDQRVGGIDAHGNRVTKTVPGKANLMRDGYGQVNTQSSNEMYSAYGNSNNTVIICSKVGGYCTQ